MDRVSDIMIKDTVCCTPLTMVEESKTMMAKYQCTKLPVVNTLKEKKIIGVINKNDIANEKGTIIHCMSKSFKAVYEDETVGECLRIMIVNNVELVPVIDKQGHLCGIVTQNEILK